jgi:hypothetical protein
MEDKVIELVRHQWPRSRTVIWLRLDMHGIACEGYDTGPDVEEWFNHDDYEYTTSVSNAELPKLIDVLTPGIVGDRETAFELLKAKYNGNPRAADELRELCEANNIAHSFDTWA